MFIILRYSYQEYVVGGENYMRVKFYLKGSRRKGTVHVDVKQVQSLKIYPASIWFLHRQTPQCYNAFRIGQTNCLQGVNLSTRQLVLNF